jgi:shikimate kinase
MPMKIAALIGPKHTGKTSVGRALAGLLGVPFTDLDEFIALRTGKQPRTLYREGSGVFRAAETEALQSLIQGMQPLSPSGPPGQVVAAGGGILDNPDAAAILTNTPGVRLLYIEVSAETAWKRIRRAAEQTGELPPFLSTADPQETHRALHTRRAADCKALAWHTIAGESGSPEEIARRILETLIMEAPKAEI